MRRVGILLVTVVFGCGDDGSGGTSGGTDSTAGTSASTGTSTSAGTMGTTSGDSTTTGMSTTTGGGTSDGGSTGGSTGGVNDGPNVDLSDPQLYEYELDPAELDPTVVNNLEMQYAFLDTRTQPLGKLVFFLPGYTNTPSNWRDHCRLMSSYGFHVIVPDYSNDWTCPGGVDNCDENTRWEALTGEDLSPVIDIGVNDSAEGRVITILNYLQGIHPGGDWAYYLNDDGTLRDEHVIIAGISHGASSSGLFASRRHFHRAVMHSGAYWNVGDTPATPIEDFYSLSHVDDDQHAGHLSTWDAAGMIGENTVIEDVAPPYNDSRRLIATTPNGYPHCSTCVSGDSPLSGDTYVFDPAWRYMYGAPQP